MLNVDFINFPVLQTERLVLRKIMDKDYELIHKLHSDPYVNAFVGRENSSSLEKAKEYILRINNSIKNKECLLWVMTLKDNDNLIGLVCCWNFEHKDNIVEIGYEMLKEFQGNGYMTEALKTVLEFTFSKINANVITAFPSSDNLNSILILRKLNFIQEDKVYNNNHKNVKNIVTYTLKS